MKYCWWKYIICSVIGGLLFSAVMAQEGQTDEGEIEEGQVIINKNLEIELPKAERKYDKVPPLPQDEKSDANLQYNFQEIDNQLPPLSPKLRVLKIKSQDREFQYSNYIKAGFGNYASPYLNAYFHNKQHRNASYGARFYHNSFAKGPVDGKNSGSGNTQIDIGGKLGGEVASATGRLGYSLDKYHFYGYPEGEVVDRDTIEQIFNTFNAGLTLESTSADSPLFLKGEVDYYYWQDNYNAQENQVSVGVKGEHKLQEDLSAGLQADFHFINYKTESTQNRSVIDIRPYAVFTEDFWKVDAAIKVVSQNDTLSSAENITIFPDVEAEYEIGYNFLAYGKLTGGIEPSTIRSFTEDNPYLGENIPVYNTIEALKLAGGIRGNIMNKVNFEAELSFGNYKNMPFYLNDSLDMKKFNILYDQGVTDVFNFSGGVSYSSEKVYGVSLLLDYFGYSTEKVQEAWHKPRFKTSIDAWYNLYDKIIISSTFYTYAGMKAYNFTTDETMTLKPAVDWNAQIDYKFSDQYGAFLMLNNILSNNYELYNQYPARALQVKLGLTASF